MTWDYYREKNGEVNIECLNQEIKDEHGNGIAVSCNYNSNPIMIQLSVDFDDTTELRNSLASLIDSHNGELCNKKIYLEDKCKAVSKKLKDTGLVESFDSMQNLDPPQVPKIKLDNSVVDMTSTHRNEIDAYTGQIRNYHVGVSDATYNSYTLQQWKDNFDSNVAPWPTKPATVISLGVV